VDRHQDVDSRETECLRAAWCPIKSRPMEEALKRVIGVISGETLSRCLTPALRHCFVAYLEWKAALEKLRTPTILAERINKLVGFDSKHAHEKLPSIPRTKSRAVLTHAVLLAGRVFLPPCHLTARSPPRPGRCSPRAHSRRCQDVPVAGPWSVAGGQPRPEQEPPRWEQPRTSAAETGGGHP
jgi:hypothetical protein